MDEKRKLYPFKFIPYPVKRSWGGSSFIEKLGKDLAVTNDEGEETPLTASDKTGEIWDIADMGLIDSVISEGWLAGNTMSELMETYLERVVGEGTYNYYGRQFPVLVKLLDIKGHSPLQVHPDDEIAEQRYDALGKTELLYIMDAAPGSRLYIGFNRDVSAQELYERCLDGTVEEVLNEITPKKGECYLITPGTVHCAMGGLLIAAIQESSDLNFSLYDRDNNDRAAEELAEAMDFIDYKKYNGSGAIKVEGGQIAEKVADCRQFQITRIKLTDPLHIYTEKFGSFIIYTSVEGEASVQVPGKDGQGKEKMENYVIRKGESLLIPAESPDFYIVPVDRSTILLETAAGVIDDADEYIDPDTEPFLEDEDYEGLEDDHHCHRHN